MNEEYEVPPNYLAKDRKTNGFSNRTTLPQVSTFIVILL
jgi:hypothetical protein